MKIEKIIVNNFRNINYFELDITSKTTIIKGANELGKSNLLNAVNLFLTGCLFTDNYGKGENDIDSIIPSHIEDANPEITLVINGIYYTKVYKTTYERGTKRINGHAWEYRINDTKYTKAQFEAMFDNAIGYSNKLVGVNEKRFLTDPLYLLFKLANEANGTKKLRDFLEINLNCNISNEEIFAADEMFLPLKKIENSYLGDFEKAYSDLGSKIREKENLIKGINATLPSDDECVVVSLVKDELELELAKLVDKKNRILNQDNSKLNEIAIELKSLELERKQIISDYEINKKAQLSDLESKKAEVIKKCNENYNKAISKFNEQLLIVKNELAGYQSQLSYSQSALKKTNGSINYFENDINSLNEKRNSLIAEYNSVKNEQISDYITCPHCGGIINDPKFEEKKKEKLARISQDGKTVKVALDLAKAKLIEEKELASKLEDEVLNLVSSISKSNDLIKELEDKINSVKKEDISALLNDLDNKIMAINNETPDTAKIDDAISKLNTEIELLQSNDNSQIQSSIDDIDSKILEIKSKIKEEEKLENNNKARIKALDDIKSIEREINELEYLKNLTMEFVNTKIQKLNDKVKDKTGVEFIMLEANLGDGSLKKTCYAVVDGVEFSNVNTAQKYEIGIKIIEKIRETAGITDDLPILIDKLESIDEEAKIFNLTNLAIICTRVGTEKNIEIIRG